MIANIIAAIAIFLIMLIAMNGYSERDAFWGLGVFLISAALITFVSSAAAVFLVRYLYTRRYSAFAAGALSSAAFSITGIIVQIIFGLIGVGVVEFVRVGH